MANTIAESHTRYFSDTCKAKRCMVADGTGDVLCRGCTKKACIWVLNRSGNIFLPEKSFYNMTQDLHGVQIDNLVFQVYKTISTPPSSNLYPDFIKEICASDASGDYGKSILLQCREIVIGSVICLRYPYDVSKLIEAIDHELQTTHRIVCCYTCSVIIGPAGMARKPCKDCRNSNRGKILATSGYSPSVILATAICQWSGLIRPLGGIVAEYAARIGSDSGKTSIANIVELSNAYAGPKNE